MPFVHFWFVYSLATCYKGTVFTGIDTGDRTIQKRRSYSASHFSSFNRITVWHLQFLFWILWTLFATGLCEPERQQLSGFKNYHKINSTWSSTCAKVLAYVTYISKYQKANIRCHTFYQGIFLTNFLKLFLI